MIFCVPHSMYLFLRMCEDLCMHMSFSKCLCGWHKHFFWRAQFLLPLSLLLVLRTARMWSSLHPDPTDPVAAQLMYVRPFLWWYLCPSITATCSSNNSVFFLKIFPYWHGPPCASQTLWGSPFLGRHCRWLMFCNKMASATRWHAALMTCTTPAAAISSYFILQPPILTSIGFTASFTGLSHSLLYYPRLWEDSSFSCPPSVPLFSSLWSLL